MPLSFLNRGIMLVIKLYHQKEQLLWIKLILDLPPITLRKTFLALWTYGKYDEIWQFSAYLVKLKFKIIDVAGTEQFEYGNIPPIKEKSDQFILRACAKGKVKKVDGIISINGRYYKTYR